MSVRSDPVCAAHNPGPMTGSGNGTYLLAGRDATATLIDAGIRESIPISRDLRPCWIDMGPG